MFTLEFTTKSGTKSGISLEFTTEKKYHKIDHYSLFFMGRKRKYPTVCNCCQPTELKDSYSAAYHKKVIMSKRSATEEAPSKKLSGLQQTGAAFVKECANGLLFDYFRNRPVIRWKNLILRNVLQFTRSSST